MPFARLTLIPAQTPAETASLATNLTALIATDLAKRHNLTSVLIETPAQTTWTIAAINQPVAAHLQVTVTTGTNTEDQKRTFIRNAMHLLRKSLPDLASATYITVHEVPAANWGYDGQTQADRSAQAR